MLYARNILCKFQVVWYDGDDGLLVLGGTMAESTKVLAPLLQVGLMQVRILVSAMRGKNVWIIGKPPAPNSVPYVPQHIDGRPAM